MGTQEGKTDLGTFLILRSLSPWNLDAQEGLQNFTFVFVTMFTQIPLSVDYSLDFLNVLTLLNYPV